MSAKFLTVGEPAPWFIAPSLTNPKFRFHTVAGRYVMLCFFGSAGDKGSQKVLEEVRRHGGIFDDEKSCFFGVSTEPEDVALSRVQQQLPGIRFFWDFDKNISRQYRVIDEADTCRDR